MEILEGDHNPFDFLEGGLEDVSDEGEPKNPFHNAGPANFVVRGELEVRLLTALESNGRRVNLQVNDFQEELHVED